MNQQYNAVSASARKDLLGKMLKGPVEIGDGYKVYKVQDSHHNLLAVVLRAPGGKTCTWNYALDFHPTRVGGTFLYALDKNPMTKESPTETEGDHIIYRAADVSINT